MAIKASVNCMLCSLTIYAWLGYARLVAICWEILEVYCSLGFFLHLEPRKVKYMHVTISCIDGHPQKFIHEKLQDDQTSKIFPIYGKLLLKNEKLEDD